MPGLQIFPKAKGEEKESPGSQVFTRIASPRVPGVVEVEEAAEDEALVAAEEGGKQALARPTSLQDHWLLHVSCARSL